MRCRRIPKTDIDVSEMCIGTMTFGDQLEGSEAIRSVECAIERGVNFFDTADIYHMKDPGASESVLGRALAGKRDKVIVASKVGGRFSPNPGDEGLGRDHVMKAIDGSLARLNMEYLDIYYLHFPDYITEASEIVQTMNELIESGKIRHFGISNFPAWLIAKISVLAEAEGMQGPVITQNVYNMVTRGVEDEILPCAADLGLGLSIYNPIAGGLLSGKYDEAQLIPGTRFYLERGYKDRYWTDENLEAARQLNQLARQSGMTLPEMSFAWLLSHEEVTSVISGFSSMQQLERNLSSFEAPLRADLPFDQINDIYKKLSVDRFPYFRKRM